MATSAEAPVPAAVFIAGVVTAAFAYSAASMDITDRTCPSAHFTVLSWGAHAICGFIAAALIALAAWYRNRPENETRLIACLALYVLAMALGSALCQSALTSNFMAIPTYFAICVAALIYLVMLCKQLKKSTKSREEVEKYARDTLMFGITCVLYSSVTMRYVDAQCQEYQAASWATIGIIEALIAVGSSVCIVRMPQIHSFRLDAIVVVVVYVKAIEDLSDAYAGVGKWFEMTFAIIDTTVLIAVVLYALYRIIEAKVGIQRFKEAFPFSRMRGGGMQPMNVGM